MFLQLLKMCRDVFLNTVHNKSFGQLPGFKVHRIHTRPYCNHYTIGLTCSTDQQTTLHMALKVIPLQKKFFILVRVELKPPSYLILKILDDKGETFCIYFMQKSNKFLGSPDEIHPQYIDMDSNPKPIFTAAYDFTSLCLWDLTVSLEGHK